MTNQEDILTGEEAVAEVQVMGELEDFQSGAEVAEEEAVEVVQDQQQAVLASLEETEERGVIMQMPPMEHSQAEVAEELEEQHQETMQAAEVAEDNVSLQPTFE